MDPDRGVLKGWSPYWFELTHAEHLTGDFERELKSAEEARRRYPDSRAGWVHEVRALASLGHVADLDSVMNAAAALPPDTYWSQGAMFIVAGEELEAHGHPGSQKYYERAIGWLANQLARDPSNKAHRYWMGSVHSTGMSWTTRRRTSSRSRTIFPTTCATAASGACPRRSRATPRWRAGDSATHRRTVAASISASSRGMRRSRAIRSARSPVERSGECRLARLGVAACVGATRSRDRDA